MINIDSILAANSSVTVEPGVAPIAVSGTVELGATSLAALETIELGATTLAALETIELGATTLAALESITVVDGGGSLTVDAADLDIRDLAFATDKVDVSGSSIEVAEAGYSSWTVVAVSVTTTESTVSALSGRLRVEIQNLGSNDIYIRQSTGVSSANGFKIPKGSSFEQSLDAGAAIYMVAAAGTSDVRIAQFAA